MTEYILEPNVPPVATAPGVGKRERTLGRWQPAARVLQVYPEGLSASISLLHRKLRRGRDMLFLRGRAMAIPAYDRRSSQILSNRRPFLVKEGGQHVFFR